MNPAAILVHALAAYDSLVLGRLARSVGLSGAEVRRAAKGAKGRPTNVALHVKLCAWLGVDPVVGGPATPPGRRAKFEALQFGAAMKMARFARGHNLREASRAARMSPTSLSRIENGRPLAFETVLAACRYARLSPQLYITATASHETVTGNRLKQKENRSTV